MNRLGPGLTMGKLLLVLVEVQGRPFKYRDVGNSSHVSSRATERSFVTGTSVLDIFSVLTRDEPSIMGVLDRVNS